MVREIKNKNFLSKLNNVNRSIFSSYAIFVILILGGTVSFYLVKQRLDIRQQAQENGADVILDFNQSTATPGQTLIVDLSVDSHSTPIQQIQFNFSYPQEKASPKIAYDNSIFSTPDEEIIGSGVVRFGRNTDKIAVGKTHIGKIEFAALQNISANDINALPNSRILNHYNKNVSLYFTKGIGPQEESNSSLLDKIINFIEGILPGK